MIDSETTVAKLYRYPVKGLKGSKIHEADLIEGRGLPGDRRFAIVRTDGNTEVEGGAWATSRAFVINSDCEGLLSLNLAVSIDDGEVDQTEIVISIPDGRSATFASGNAGGLQEVNELLASYLASRDGNNVEAPAIVERDSGQGYWDYRDTPVSIINLATVEAIGRAAGRTLDPLRFRGNLYVAGLPAWEENGWLGLRLKVGEAELIVIRGCERCPATSVDPQSGERDMQLPTLMQQSFGHIFCGVYAQVVKTGRVAANDRIEVLGPANRNPLDGLPDNAPDYARWPRIAEVCWKGDEDVGGVAIKLAPVGPWPLPAASVGQKIRVHLGDPGWFQARLVDFEGGRYHLAIAQDGKMGTALAAFSDIASEGARVLISGPYGRPKSQRENAEWSDRKSVHGLF